MQPLKSNTQAGEGLCLSKWRFRKAKNNPNPCFHVTNAEGPTWIEIGFTRRLCACAHQAAGGSGGGQKYYIYCFISSILFEYVGKGLIHTPVQRPCLKSQQFCPWQIYRTSRLTFYNREILTPKYLEMKTTGILSVKPSHPCSHYNRPFLFPYFLLRNDLF